MNKEQLKKLEADLWRAADSLRANSDLKASEYSTPVLGLIFLKFADNKYRQHEAAILAEYQKLKGSRREEKLSDIAIRHCGFYLPDPARYGHLLNLPEKEDIAKALKKAMEAIEDYKPELAGVLPQDEYFRLTRSAQNKGLAQRLLKIFSDIPLDAGGDLFGKIYEYFLANFAMSEGQGGGEFFTPRSVVKLMVEIIEPHGGKVFDPACGSGGMFVQSAEFIAAHRDDLAAQGQAQDSIYVYGQEKTLETVKLAKMNLAVNGLHGSVIRPTPTPKTRTAAWASLTMLWRTRLSMWTTWPWPPLKKTRALTPMACRATRPNLKSPRWAWRPCPTPTTCGSTCLPPRSNPKAAPRW
jgi:type I restriction enzyme M protein